jgi:DHA1 family multidrug resistance protein-like MFS transporter
MERWKINLYTLWVTQVLALMSFGFGLPFLPFYIQELGIVDPAQINFYTGLASTIPAATMVVSAPIWGLLADRYGRKLMLMRAMIAAVFIIGAMGLVTNIGQLLVLRALQGIFTGTITASMAFVSANTPENKMSTALGFMTSSNFIGYSIGPVMGGIMAESLGYRFCFLSGGALMIISLLLVGFLLKEDKTTYGPRLGDSPIKEERRKVKEVETMDDETMMSAGQSIPHLSEGKAIPIKNIKGPAKGHGNKIHYSQGAKLLTPLIIMLLTLLFLNRMARIIFTPFIPLFVQENLNTITGAATYTGIINGIIGVAGALAAITLARLGDRYEKSRVVMVLSLISLPLAILISFASSLVVFIILFAVFSFVVGGVEPILTSSASEHTSPAKRGMLFGFLGAVGNGAFMIAPLIGVYISVNFSIHAILYAIPVFMLIQIALVYNETKAEGGVE